MMVSLITISFLIYSTSILLSLHCERWAFLSINIHFSLNAATFISKINNFYNSYYEWLLRFHYKYYLTNCICNQKSDWGQKCEWKEIMKYWKQNEPKENRVENGLERITTLGPKRRERIKRKQRITWEHGNIKFNTK